MIDKTLRYTVGTPWGHTVVPTNLLTDSQRLRDSRWLGQQESLRSTLCGEPDQESYNGDALGVLDDILFAPRVCSLK